jgi:transposase
MKRAEWLQETRKMRFEEAYGGWQGGRLTQEEAARLLGVCERTFRRYIDRYEDEGLNRPDRQAAESVIAPASAGG